MRNTLIIIPIMTLLVDCAILLNVPLLREIRIFIFLSFIPGYAILRLLKLKEINFVGVFLFSIGLSIAFVMFIGFLVNEFYLFLGFSQPLSIIPLTMAISTFTLIFFFIEYRRSPSESLKFENNF